MTNAEERLSNTRRTAPVAGFISSPLAPLVITGVGTEDGLRANPGIYLGRFPIRALFRVFGHTATAEVTESGAIAVTELVGLWRHLFQEIELHRPHPFYGGFATYRWVKVANLDVLDAYRRSAQAAKDAYQNNLYTASSNRFVSTVLRDSGILLTREVVDVLGRSPGILWKY